MELSTIKKIIKEHGNEFFENMMEQYITIQNNIDSQRRLSKEWINDTGGMLNPDMYNLLKLYAEQIDNLQNLIITDLESLKDYKYHIQ